MLARRFTATISSLSRPFRRLLRQQSKLSRAACEAIEPRRYLTTAPYFYGAPTINEGSTYELKLGYAGDTPGSWDHQLGRRHFAAIDLRQSHVGYACVYG
jgi:hypothetical protein